MEKENNENEILDFNEEEFMLNDKKDEEEPIVIKQELDIEPIIESTKLNEVKATDKLVEEVQTQIEDTNGETKEKIVSEVQEEIKTVNDAEKLKPKKEKKPVSKKVFYLQLTFCIISAIFLLGCSLFYGSRLIKFYKVYNPKTEDGEKVELLGSSITTNSELSTEGEGLYRIGGSYLYKGENVDNYIKYNNNLWRIIKINGDGSIDMVMENAINVLDWNSEVTTYEDSDIRQYLNDVFLKSLNKDLLVQTTYFKDLVDRKMFV